MPSPVKMPKVRMVAISNVISEKKPSAATSPAVNMTGATLAKDSTTARSFKALSGSRGCRARSRPYSS